ncbi:hypothetical protein OH781_32070 [Streptomyces sp. NBC_01550]|uniref:hypothetical protein n=1 Tax=Streptomyces sp. NBC_01550 TaxID=2975875 RepID=UPI0038688BA7
MGAVGQAASGVLAARIFARVAAINCAATGANRSSSRLAVLVGPFGCRVPDGEKVHHLPAHRVPHGDHRPRAEGAEECVQVVRHLGRDLGG